MVGGTDGVGNTAGGGTADGTVAAGSIVEDGTVVGGMVLDSKSMRLDESVEEEAVEYWISGIGGDWMASFKACDNSLTVVVKVSWNRFSRAMLSCFICSCIRFICWSMAKLSSVGGCAWLVRYGLYCWYGCA